MVQTCVVRGCGSSWYPGGDIRFHAFPKNSTQRKLWLSIVPLKIKFYESARICNLHFQESDYDSTTRRLKPTAVPAVIINEETVSPGKTTSSLHEEPMVQIAALAVPSNSFSLYESNSPLKITGVKRTGCNIEDQTRKKQCRKNFENVSSEDDNPAKIDRGVQVDIKSTKEEILEKKTKILKQKVRRLTKKIQDMSSLMANIKKYTCQPEIENIIQGRFADICKHFKKPQSNPHGVRYSEEVKAFALTLNFYSPKAYEFLRKYITLPHVETIRKSVVYRPM